MTPRHTAPEDIVAFWFPASDRTHAQEHQRLWNWRQRGGAHHAMVTQFAALTERAAAGELDAWAQSATGRLALIVILDPFARLVWAGTSQAYANDTKARDLCLQGLANGHFDALPRAWCKSAFKMPLEHCECTDPVEHLVNLDTAIAIAIADQLTQQAPVELRPWYELSAGQARRHRAVIAQFGRFPHRNALLQRQNTPAELAFIASGDLPLTKAP